MDIFKNTFLKLRAKNTPIRPSQNNENIKKIIFNNGKELNLLPNSLVIITGPNGAGKTSLLNEFENSIKASLYKNLFIKSLDISSIDKNNLIDWLNSRFSFTKFENDDGIWSYKEVALKKSDLEEYIKTNDKNLYSSIEVGKYESKKTVNELIKYFFSDSLSTQERLEIVEPKKRYDMNNHNFKEYIHLLQYNETLAQKISLNVKRLFGKGIIVNNAGADEVWFHFGDLENIESIDRINPQYLESLSKLPRLHKQGDGIKSYVGILLSIYCGTTPYLFIDEPESFLHPPYARALGEELANSLDENSPRQIFISTHSKDLLEGAISTGKNIYLIRVTEKDNNKREVEVYDSNFLKKIGTDDYLRVSNALNGLFYNGIVLCEADVDAQFYSTILKDYFAKNDIPLSKEIFFLNCQGKQGINKVASYLKDLGIKYGAILDIDVLRGNTDSIKNLLEQKNKKYTSFERDVNKLNTSLVNAARIKGKKTSELITELENFISTNRDKNISDFNLNLLCSLKHSYSDWAMIKQMGIRLLQGSDLTEAKQLFNNLSKEGIFVVHNGELESWTDTGGKSIEWLSNALSKIEQEYSENKQLEIVDFIKNVYNYISL